MQKITISRYLLMFKLNEKVIPLSIFILSSGAAFANETVDVPKEVTTQVSMKDDSAEIDSTELVNSDVTKPATKTEKLADDPTKIVTKLGVGYTDEMTFSGSLGLDSARKINASINEDASEWRLGGSWLFDIGIVNFNFSRAAYDHDGYKNNYSVGTFVPLSYFDITPMGWQIFPMAGFSYNEGETAQETPSSFDLNNYVLTSSASYGGYLGAFALLPLSDKWTLMSFAGGNLGSDDYSGYWAGAGLSFAINGQNSLSLFGFISEDNYGKQDKISLSYTHEFDGL